MRQTVEAADQPYISKSPSSSLIASPSRSPVRVRKRIKILFRSHGAASMSARSSASENASGYLLGRPRDRHPQHISADPVSLLFRRTRESSQGPTNLVHRIRLELSVNQLKLNALTFSAVRSAGRLTSWSARRAAVRGLARANR